MPAPRRKCTRLGPQVCPRAARAAREPQWRRGATTPMLPTMRREQQHVHRWRLHPVRLHASHARSQAPLPRPAAPPRRPRARTATQAGRRAVGSRQGRRARRRPPRPGSAQAAPRRRARVPRRYPGSPRGRGRPRRRAPGGPGASQHACPRAQNHPLPACVPRSARARAAETWPTARAPGSEQATAPLLHAGAHKAGDCPT
mmetsp:Transcript_150073/g.482347  ORF Transcript_150073/g.482347 Transcript_150073/m.482347 type:complete len:201 (+) Transcript_150073:398-1000(+)